MPACPEDPFAKLIDSFVGPTPLPAGGAGGIVAISMGAALGVKVLRISQQQVLADELAQILEKTKPLFHQDIEVFESLLSAFRTPRRTAGRTEKVQRAWQAATAAPVEVVTQADKIEALLSRCEGVVKQSVKGDLSAAIELTRAGRRIARANALENAANLDPTIAESTLRNLK